MAVIRETIDEDSLWLVLLERLPPPTECGKVEELLDLADRFLDATDEEAT